MVTRKAKKLIYNTIIICLLLGGIIYVCSRFVHFGRVEYTDNAQVRQHITPVNTRVAGFIKRICFEEYKPVRKGDTLLIIEDSEFRLRLAQAEADLANALAARQATSAGIATTRNNLSVSDAGIEETRVRMVKKIPVGIRRITRMDSGSVPPPGRGMENKSPQSKLYPASIICVILSSIKNVSYFLP